MLDLKWLAENNEEAIKRLSTRKGDFNYLKEVPKLTLKRSELIQTSDNLKNKRNTASKEIGIYKREGKDPKSILDQIENIGQEIKDFDKQIQDIEEKLQNIVLNTPNLPHKSIPIGEDENANKIIRVVGEPTKFSFKPKDHVELSQNLKLLNFDAAARTTSARFVYDVGLGARLERSLIQFMMDLHAFEHDYIECIPPYIINEESMYATGQLPKFKEDAFKIEGLPWYLNPTAEVPMINMYRNDIIDGDLLPIKYCAYTTAFRSEAGSAGRDTRGILRQHQFHKVELIKITKPEESYQELEKMVKDSEKVLQLLQIPYRVVQLSTGDLGFSMAMTYDIEVWLPGQDKYREIGSISNAEDYQARRGNIRFKRSKESKTEYVHTLNGSGLAVGRTMIAILENYQNEDGTITIPEVLVPYMRINTIK